MDSTLSLNGGRKKYTVVVNIKYQQKHWFDHLKSNQDLYSFRGGSITRFHLHLTILETENELASFVQNLLFKLKVLRILYCFSTL